MFMSEHKTLDFDFQTNAFLKPTQFIMMNNDNNV